MATIIDALLVTLGLDTSGFKKGQAEADEALKRTKDNTVKHAKDIEAKAKVATDSFKGMRREILGLVGAFASVGAIKGFVQNVVTGDAAVGRLAETLGMSTEKLKAWQGLAEKFGGSAGDIDASLRHIFTFKENWNRGMVDQGVQNSLAQLLNSDDFAKFVHRATTAAEAMEILQRAVANNGDKGKSMSLMQGAGFSEATVVVMREIGNKLGDLIDEQIKLNGLTKDQTEEAKKLLAAWQDVSKAIESAGRNLLYTVAPAMEKIMKDMVPVIGFLTGSPASESTLGTRAYDLTNRTDEKTGKKLGFWESLWKSANEGVKPEGWKPAPGRKVSGKVTEERAASSPATAGNSYLVGTKEFADMLENDIRNGARFEGTALEQITGRLGPKNAAALLNSRQQSAAGSSKTEVSIGTLTVNTQATDAPGIARDIGSAIRANYSLTGQLNYGTD